MKLYIPTCTLNFNNILATESISPEAFYSIRGFGNKRYYPVSANGLADCILLYSKYPLFEVGNSDMENYPLVVEIETDDYSDSDGKFKLQERINEVDVYSCFDTIYLNPFHCHFYFSNKDEFLCASTLAEQSSENKFYDLYSGCFCIRQEKDCTNKTFSLGSGNLNEFKWDKSYEPRNMNLSSAHGATDDALLDRVKGFLYCYFIGANTSLSKEVSELRAISRNLLNTLSAVLKSPSGRPSDAQDKDLCENIKNFESIFSKVDEAAASNKKKIDDFLSKNPDGLSVEQCFRLFEYIGCKPNFHQKLRLSPAFDVRDLWSCIEYKSEDKYSRFSDRLEAAVSSIEKKELSKATKHSIHELVEIGEGFTIQIKDLQKKEFYEKLILSQIKAEYRSDVGEYGEQLALVLNGGRILKDLMSKKWDNSPTQDYVNQLLRHFQDNLPFDIFSSVNITLQSFALFCQKGQEVDKLLNYAGKIGIGNVQLALGLCGATYGFAKLPKTFTSQLIKRDSYYLDFYKTVCKDLFGVDSKDAEILPHKRTVSDAYVGESSGSSSMIVSLQEKDRIKPKDFMSEFGKASSKRTNAFEALKKAGMEKDDNWWGVDEFCAKVYDIVEPKLPKGKKRSEDVRSKIQDCISKAKQSFESSTGSMKICGDRTIISHAESVFRIIRGSDEFGEYKEKIIELFRSFCDGYHPGGYYYSNQEKYPRVNNRLIEHFHNFCTSSKTNKGKSIPDDMLQHLEKKMLEDFGS